MACWYAPLAVFPRYFRPIADVRSPRMLGAENVVVLFRRYFVKGNIREEVGLSTELGKRCNSLVRGGQEGGARGRGKGGKRGEGGGQRKLVRNSGGIPVRSVAFVSRRTNIVSVVVLNMFLDAMSGAAYDASFMRSLVHVLVGMEDEHQPCMKESCC